MHGPVTDSRFEIRNSKLLISNLESRIVLCLPTDNSQVIIPTTRFTWKMRSMEKRMGAPKISVCVPNYNFAEFLPRAIDSVLQQTFPDFEFLIIDDCSTDGSAEVIHNYAARDRRIRFIANPENLGMVGNWNLCLAEAKGEYIKYVFADDFLISPEALQKVLALCEGDSSVMLAGSSRNFVDPQGRFTQNVCPFKRDGIFAGKWVINRCLAAQKNLIGEPTAVMFRKKDAAPGFNPKYSQIVDQEMWFRLLERGNFAHAKEPLCAFRLHSGQQSAKNSNHRSAIDEVFWLNTEYLRKDFVKISEFSRRYIVYDNIDRLWKHYRVNHVPRLVAAADIESRYGYRKFRLLYPFYKSYKPFLRLFRKIATRLGA